MIEVLLIFILGCVALLLAAYFIGIGLAVLLMTLPALGLAYGLVLLGLPVWLSGLVGFGAWLFIVGEISERRQARKRQNSETSD